MPMRFRPKGHWIATGLDHEGNVTYAKAPPPRRTALPDAETRGELRMRRIRDAKRTQREQRAEARMIREEVGVAVR